MIRKLILAGIIVGSVFSFLGCQKYEYIKDVECKVVNKHFEEGYTETIMQTLPDGNGGFIYSPLTQYYPDECITTVENKEYNLKAATYSIDFYNKYNVGDEVDLELFKSENKYKLVFKNN